MTGCGSEVELLTSRICERRLSKKQHTKTKKTKKANILHMSPVSPLQRFMGPLLYIINTDTMCFMKKLARPPKAIKIMFLGLFWFP
jgi:hypothetical protein